MPRQIAVDGTHLTKVSTPTETQLAIARPVPQGGSNTQILSLVGGVPTWVAAPSSGNPLSPVVLLWTGSAYPARPAGVTYVQFHGPTDPLLVGATVVDGDSWFDTDASEPETRVITTDQVNATLTLANIEQLSYPVIAGNRYSFAYVIGYNVNAQTTGTRFVLNGPATSFLSYFYDSLPVGAGAVTRNTPAHYNAYLLPAAVSTATPNVVGNMMTMTGMIIPSASGNLVPQFASEVAVANAVTIRMGSLWIVRS